MLVTEAPVESELATETKAVTFKIEYAMHLGGVRERCHIFLLNGYDAK